MSVRYFCDKCGAEIGSMTGNFFEDGALKVEVVGCEDVCGECVERLMGSLLASRFARRRPSVVSSESETEKGSLSGSASPGDGEVVGLISTREYAEEFGIDLIRARNMVYNHKLKPVRRRSATKGGNLYRRDDLDEVFRNAGNEEMLKSGVDATDTETEARDDEGSVDVEPREAISPGIASPDDGEVSGLITVREYAEKFGINIWKARNTVRRRNVMPFRKRAAAIGGNLYRQEDLDEVFRNAGNEEMLKSGIEATGGEVGMGADVISDPEEFAGMVGKTVDYVDRQGERHQAVLVSFNSPTATFKRKDGAIDRMFFGSTLVRRIA